jgi:hypothetical protein
MTSASTNPTEVHRSLLRRHPLLWTALCTLILSVPIIVVVDHYWPYRYRNVEPTLESVFASQIKIDKYHRTYFPYPGFVADGVTLRRNSAPNFPPVGSIQHVRVQGRWGDLFMLRRVIHRVLAEGLHIVIPPVGSAANRQDFPPGSANVVTGHTTVHVHGSNAGSPSSQPLTSPPTAAASKIFFASSPPPPLRSPAPSKCTPTQSWPPQPKEPPSFIA